MLVEHLKPSLGATTGGLTLATLRERLWTKYQCLKKQENGSKKKSMESALTASGGGQFKEKCFNCKKNGHMAKDC